MAQLDLIVKVAVQGARQLDSLGGNLSNTGAKLTRNVTLPVLAAGAGITKLAADAQQSQAKVNSVFKSMGASAFTSIEALNKHAEAMADATTFDDDAIKEAQATLLTFGNITEESFGRATETVADMAAFFGTDMQSASIQLGKALNDPIKGLASLARIGVQFTEEQQAMITSMVEAGDVAGAQAIILGELDRQIGTVAEDLAATDAGKMTQAMNELGEAGEALGTFLLPVLSTVAGALKGMAEGFQSLPGPVQGGIVAFAALAAVIGPVVGIIGGIITAFGKVGTAFRILSTLLMANPFLILIAAVAALVTIIVLNWDKIVKVVTGAIDAIMGALRTAYGAVIRLGEKIWTPLSEGFSAAIGAIKGVWNAFARWWNSIQIGIPAFDVPFVGTFGGFNIGLPDLPYLAEGGIVNQPTLAVIGERGPEAVVPLGSGMMGAVNNFTFHVQGEVDEERVVSVVERAQRLERSLAWG